jgi:hypothetical protein
VCIAEIYGKGAKTTNDFAGKKNTFHYVYILKIVASVLFILVAVSVADPGSGAFLTLDPGSGIGFSGSRIPNPFF